MSLWTSLEPASTTVDPGSSTRVRLRVRNTGDVVDEYRFEPVGPVAPWTTVEPGTLRLYPGTTGTVELTFAPPRTPDAEAGPNPYAVRITPTEHPEAVTVPEGNLTVTPFTEVRAELVPPVVKGRFRGRPRLAVDNLGNTKVTASLSGSDNGDKLAYEMRPANVQIEPGRAVFVDTTLRPRQIIWFGSKEEQHYKLALRRSGAQPVDVDGTFVQRGFLPRWLMTVFGIFLTLAIAFVMIWLAYKPQVHSLAREKLQETGSTLPPPPPTSAPPSPSATPSKEPEPVQSQPKGGGGGGEEKKKKPRERTAADAVRDAVELKPGRHICYRALVADKGWQKPVCDGADPVETEGSWEGKPPIKALNIATSGTKGVHAAAAYALGGWKEPWVTKPDGQNLYIGSSKESESPLQGYTIKVPDGSVCQVARIEVDGWRPLGCTKPGEWMYGGADMMKEETRGRKLVAFRFSV
ncbi:COG1470 family protein [Streptomyces physcomitrii]|uniref:Hydrolase n=1 Tax=Streptomyces physcomitrii TaxID=2724184 RepID=A0ABX1GVW4_9ACTN|nr:hydrolase [Streptomyces physcomitrii]NKI39907.1 hydrolase [Streptomyces physcomitrii]